MHCMNLSVNGWMASRALSSRPEKTIYHMQKAVHRDLAKMSPVPKTPTESIAVCVLCEETFNSCDEKKLLRLWCAANERWSLGPDIHCVTQNIVRYPRVFFIIRLKPKGSDIDDGVASNWILYLDLIVAPVILFVLSNVCLILLFTDPLTAELEQWLGTDAKQMFTSAASH